MGKKNVTFDDIAKYTNFSKTTISRYFNNPDSLTLENQAIIAKALKDLNYQENKLARSLASGKTEIIGVILPNMYMHYYQEVLHQLLSTYRKHGYKFLVFLGDNDPEVERQHIRVLLAHKVEGLITLSPTLSSEELASYKIPIVSIEREDRAICSVNTDNYKGAYEATSLLIQKGCTLLVHINDIALFTDDPCRLRVNGFQDCCEKAQIKYETIIRDLGKSFKATRQVMKDIVEMLDEKYPSEKIGIFVCTDTYANNLINYLLHRDNTLSLFPRYQIVGFDDSPIAEESILSITTVAQRIDLMAKEAMELLILQMNEQKKRRPKPLEKPIHQVVTPVLIERETTM